MRTLALLALAGCTAQAAPPVAGGGGAAGGAGSDTTAIHDNEASEITALTQSAVAADIELLGELSAGTKRAFTGLAIATYAANYGTLSGTLADIQAVSCTVGQRGEPTDSPYTLLCRSAGTWSYRYPGIGFDVTPPGVSAPTGWTAFNSGSVTASGGTRILTVPAETSAGGLRGEYRDRVSDPTVASYCVDWVFSAPWTGSNGAGNAGYGAMFTNATGVAWGSTGADAAFQASRWTNATTFSATDAAALGVGQFLFGIRIAEDATERHFYVLDLLTGATVTELGAGYGRTVTITADKVGWAALGSDADLARRVRLVHYAESSCTP